MTLLGAIASKERPRADVPAVPVRLSGGSKYGRRALEDETNELRGTPEGERNDRLNRAAFAAGQLVAGGEIADGEARAALTAAARACGLGEHEIQATLASGMEAGRKEPRSAPPRPSRAVPANDNGPDDYLDDLLDSSGEASELPDRNGETAEPLPQEQPTAEEPLRGLTHLAAVALVGRDRILEMAAKPIDYVWKDIVVGGTIALIAGPPADGKTTLLFLILAARANLEAPISLLGRELQPAPPGQFIVVIEGEHSESSTSRKLIKSLHLLGVDDMALERVIIVARKAVRLGSPEWDDVKRMVAAGLVSDIAVDTVARVAPANADSEQDQVEVFDGIAQAIETAPEGTPQPTVWAVAHTRKNNTNGELTDVSGSVQRVGQSDTVLLVKAERADGRVVSSRTTFAKLREDPDEWPEPMELSISKAPDGTPTLTTTASSGGRNMAPDDGRPLEARIIEQLQHGPCTKSALATSTKRSRRDIEAAITNLFAQRAITTVNVTIKGTDRKAFELTSGGKTAEWPTPDSTPDSYRHGTNTGRTPDDME
jgi:hypothetical protein